MRKKLTRLARPLSDVTATAKRLTDAKGILTAETAKANGRFSKLEAASNGTGSQTTDSSLADSRRTDPFSASFSSLAQQDFWSSAAHAHRDRAAVRNVTRATYALEDSTLLEPTKWSMH